MILTITLPETDVQALKAKATAHGMTAEQYALHILERDLAPDWLRGSWTTAQQSGLSQLSMDEIESEIASARQARRETNPPSGA